MSKILIVGNPDSPLVRERGLVGQSAGHQIFWFSPRKAKISGVKSYGLPEFISGLPLLGQILQPIYFWRACKAIEPDLVHVHYASKGLLAPSLSRFHPLVVTAMGSDISPSVGYRGLFVPFTRLLLESADLITVKSTYMVKMLHQIGDFANKTERITWGVDLDLFRPDRETKTIRNRMGISDKALVFFDPRAMRRLYNKHIVLEAFRRYLNAGGPEAVLLLAGYNADRRYLGQLKRQVKSLNLEKSVQLLPRQGREEMADLYALADVVISVPSSDGFPQSIYEAWASGRFMILGDLPQYHEELGDGSTARLVGVGDVQALAAALRWVAQHPEVRQAAKEAGRARAKSVADKTGESKKLNQLYARLLSSTYD